jgi:PhnB protein
MALKKKRSASRKSPSRKSAARKSAASKAAPKKKSVPAIPAGYHAITPYLAIQNAAAALDFYKRAFGARELLRMAMPNGKLAHAEMRVGDSVVMMADESQEQDFLGPQARGGSTVTIHLYVRDVDRMFRQAVEAGAKVVRDLQDQFYGDRTACVADPFGHIWYLATHKEEVPPAEMKKRAAKAMQGG